jgi:uncharacterized protein YdaU (DUF1376 family)
MKTKNANNAMIEVQNCFTGAATCQERLKKIEVILNEFFCSDSFPEE